MILILVRKKNKVIIGSIILQLDAKGEWKSKGWK